MRTALTVSVLALFLAGCAKTVPWETPHPPEYSGLNYANIKAQCPKDSFCPKRVEIYGGKEQDNIKVTYQTPEGTKTLYEAGGVRAFDGQAIRAEVEKAISEDVKEVAPGIVDAIVQSVRKAITGGA